MSSNYILPDIDMITALLVQIQNAIQNSERMHVCDCKAGRNVFNKSFKLGTVSYFFEDTNCNTIKEDSEKTVLTI